MRGFHCEAADHEGDRRIANPFDQFNVSLDFVRTDGKDRLGRVSLTEAKTFGEVPIGPARVCRRCANRWLRRMRHPDVPGQAALL